MKNLAELVGDGGFLPDDILADILSSFHSKTLLRMMTVCKRWESLISSSDFKRLHEEKWSKRPNLLLLSGSRYVGFLLVTLSLTGEELDRWKIPLVCPLKVEMLPSPCGPKNLVCLVVDSEEFVVCMPSLRKTILVPQLPYSCSDRLSAYGFCHLPDRNQHVIVCSSDKKDWQITTYSDGSPSFAPWKPVVGGIDFRIIGPQCGTFANGSLYWIGCKLLSGPSLLCFDLYEEKFSTVAAWDQIRDASSYFLVELKGDLHLMTEVSKTHTLWKLDVANQAWMEQHTFGRYLWPFSTQLIGSHDGAMLFRNEHLLVWFSPQSKVKFRSERVVIFQYPQLGLKLHTDVLYS